MTSGSPSLLSFCFRSIRIQTPPASVQSRILSFLAVEARRFPAEQLLSPAGKVSCNCGRRRELDFWVRRSALQQFDRVSHGTRLGLSSDWVEIGGKYGLGLKLHKGSLVRGVGETDTFLTKSMLANLSDLEAVRFVGLCSNVENTWFSMISVHKVVSLFSGCIPSKLMEDDVDRALPWLPLPTTRFSLGR